MISASCLTNPYVKPQSNRDHIKTFTILQELSPPRDINNCFFNTHN